MSQERWDVKLRFLEGSLAFQGDVVYRGPLVRMGANPGPGGLKLEGYRALDDRQAVIQSYDGGTVSIAPVGTNQVRVAPHENQDWNEIPPIRGPVFLSPGTAFHLGPPGRGVTGIFVESQRLGVWEQQKIQSTAQNVDDIQVGELQTDKGRPPWFIPMVVLIGIAVSVGVTIQLVKPPPIERIGPVDEGQEYYDFVLESEPVDPKLKEGFDAGINDFVMKYNADASNNPSLKASPEKWDQRFVEYVVRSAKMHGKGFSFWRRLDQIKDDYASTVIQLRAAGLPEVFAAIPYQESRYNSSSQSYVCAKGYWQFMPEVAFRVGLSVSSCKLRGTDQRWSPSEKVVPPELKRVYYDPPSGNERIGSCKIQDCQVDDREDLSASTRAALKMLAEPMGDPELRASGSLVQMSILSHNMGYDDSRFSAGRRSGVLWAWRRYAEANKVKTDPKFYGNNILCTDPTAPPNDKCGGVLWKETQHYAYNIVAQHLLAVCYYARNYGDVAPFDQWKQYDRGNGYCTTTVQVPDVAQVRGSGGGK